MHLYQGVLLVHSGFHYLQEITELMESLEEEVSPDITVLVCRRYFRDILVANTTVIKYLKLKDSTVIAVSP